MYHLLAAEFAALDQRRRLASTMPIAHVFAQQGLSGHLLTRQLNAIARKLSLRRLLPINLLAFRPRGLSGRALSPRSSCIFFKLLGQIERGRVPIPPYACRSQRAPPVCSASIAPAHGFRPDYHLVRYAQRHIHAYRGSVAPPDHAAAPRSRNGPSCLTAGFRTCGRPPPSPWHRTLQGMPRVGHE